MSKLIYKIIFFSMSYLVHISVPYKFKAWYRNSIFCHYFSFGKSDLDISIKILDEVNLISQTKKISNLFFKCKLIQEINFYYPTNLKYLQILINPLELKRDPILALKYKPIKFSSEDSFIYLLRMFFANLEKISKGLNKRDLKKWQYHFEQAQLNSSEMLRVSMNDIELIELIIKSFNFEDNHKYQLTLIYFINQKKSNSSTGEIYTSSIYKHELMTLLPHVFCISNDDYLPKNETELNLYLKQLSWEILGLSTQPHLIGESVIQMKHFKNVQHALDKIKREDQTKELKLATIEIMNCFLK